MEAPLNVTPVKLQSWTPKWRGEKAKGVAEKYGTTVTAMINEGLDLVMAQLEGRLPRQLAEIDQQSLAS